MTSSSYIKRLSTFVYRGSSIYRKTFAMSCLLDVSTVFFFFFEKVSTCRNCALTKILSSAGLQIITAERVLSVVM